MKSVAIVAAPLMALVLAGCTTDVVREVPREELGSPSEIATPGGEMGDMSAEQAASDVVEQRMREPFAIDLLTREGFIIRVVERDGEPYPVTMDYSSDRINLVISNGVVTDAFVG